jgi:hypothetical protein
MKNLFSKLREVEADKLLHFIAGMIIFMTLFRVFAIFMPMRCSYLISYFMSILASYAKEAIYDRRMKKGVYNIKDFYAGVFGSTVALCLDLMLLLMGLL